jgi:hypothetical protein
MVGIRFCARRGLVPSSILGTSFSFNRLSRRELPIGVRLKAQATCLQYTTVPGSNTACWTRDGR